MAFAGWHIVHDSGGLKSADIATLLGVPIGVTGLVIAVAASRRPFEGNDAELARGWATTLARQVETGESMARRQLLGADTRRINLAYVLHPAQGRVATAPLAGRTFTDAAPAVLPDVLGYYRATRPRRLVITGAAGAGKTVLALELMLTLLGDRADDDPVPVRIPLAQWDTSQPLRTLLVQRLVDAYDWPPDLAAGLVDQGMVLPVLDGLDEMDPVRDDGTPDPQAPQALAVLEALDAYQEGLDAGPLVVTCRNQHYDALGPGLQLIDSARITIAPVNTQQAITYLRDRARDAPRWQPLLAYLQAWPTGPLAATLSTPWRLCLTATVYHRTGNPAELLHHPTADDLDQHLLARYIPAATANASNPHYYPPDQVHRWLHHLTHHLNGNTTVTNTTELTLHRLWPLAGRTRVRITDALLTTISTVTISTVTLTAAAALIPFFLDYVGFGAVVAIVAVTAGISAFFPPSNPKRLANLNNITRAFAAGLPYGLAAVLLFGLALELSYGPPYEFTSVPVNGLAFGLPAWLAAVVVRGFTGQPTTLANPRAIIHDDIVYGLTTSLAFGLVFGLAADTERVALGDTMHPYDLMTRLTEILQYGLAVTFGFGLGFGLRAARRYAVFLLCSHGRLPFRLARFLDWAVTAGLLRYSGPSYQFRHRELQQWLTQHPHP
ncbi:NACHT domain-containing protein [Streptomyces cyslabdanicus]|uniref:NACHT domain-containing protein n=1 Tax=Streptomyces cyslabdanicus TaxID=1470456 RepID=UPI004043FE2F